MPGDSISKSIRYVVASPCRAEQLTHLGQKKIAVFDQNDAFGKAGLDGVRLALERLSLKPVAQSHGRTRTAGSARKA